MYIFAQIWKIELISKSEIRKSWTLRRHQKGWASLVIQVLSNSRGQTLRAIVFVKTHFVVLPALFVVRFCAQLRPARVQ